LRAYFCTAFADKAIGNHLNPSSWSKQKIIHWFGGWFSSLQQPH